ncbi:MAG: hypothetical protein KGZ63_05520 [Clostridiales bacterium]|jgi:hypothetical protein|nr:hypothetical protein [Clostridiales bacterium]
MYLRIFNHDKSKIKQMITKEIDGNPADVIIFEDNSFRILTRFIDSDNVKIGYDLAKEENYDFGTLATQTQTRYFYGLGNKQVKTEGKTYAPYLVSTSVLITDFRITSSSPYLEITDVSTAGTSATWPRTLHSVSCQIVTKTGSTVKSKGNYWYKITYDNGTVGDRTEEIRETITWHYSSLEGHYAKVYSEWIY